MASNAAGRVGVPVHGLWQWRPAPHEPMVGASAGKWPTGAGNFRPACIVGVPGHRAGTTSVGEPAGWPKR